MLTATRDRVIERTRRHEERHPPGVQDHRGHLLLRSTFSTRSRQRAARSASRPAAPATRSTRQAACAGHRGPGSRSSRPSTPRSTRRRRSSCFNGARILARRVRAPFAYGENTVSNDRLTTLLEEYADLEKRMEDPSIHADQALVRRVGPPLRRSWRRCTPRTPSSRRPAPTWPRPGNSRPRPGLRLGGGGGRRRAASAGGELGEMLIPRDPSDAKT